MASIEQPKLAFRALRVSVGLLLLPFSHAVNAASIDVYWSGFAFDGDYVAANARYPNSFALSQQMDADRPLLDKHLGAKAQGLDNRTFQIIFDKGSIGPDAPSSVALAFVLDRETVSVEKIGDRYKVLVALSAQAMFFDFKEMAVVSTYPLSLNYIHSQTSEPVDADLRRLVESMYLGAGNANMFDLFIEALAKAELNTNINRRIQVTDVSIDPSVIETLPALWQENVKDFGVFLSQQFGRYLSEHQNVPVLPYTKGHAIGNRMSASFAEGEVYSLEFPEPDYPLSLALQKLVKIEYAKVAAGTSYVYGSYLGVTAQEPLSGRTYLDTTIKNGEVKKVPAAQTFLDDWPAFQDSILGLISKFTAEIGSPSKQWVQKHIGDVDVLQQLTALGKVVQSCR